MGAVPGGGIEVSNNQGDFFSLRKGRVCVCVCVGAHACMHKCVGTVHGLWCPP